MLFSSNNLPVFLKQWLKWLIKTEQMKSSGALAAACFSSSVHSYDLFFFFSTFVRPVSYPFKASVTCAEGCNERHNSIQLLLNTEPNYLLP